MAHVNGRLRDRIKAQASITEAEATKLALASEHPQGQIEGKTVSRVIYVPGKLVNIVVA